MSQTTSSALNNRIVKFVDFDNEDFDCVICYQIADEPVRCNSMCSGIYCNGCMQQALNRYNCCPSCSRNDATALKDEVLRNQTMNHQVYCINNTDIDIDIDTDQATSKSNGYPKESSDSKCSWIGKYDELSIHINHCEFELLSCPNDECEEKIERRKFEQHLISCIHRTTICVYCNKTIKSTQVEDHLSRCPKVEVSCVCEYKCTRDMMDEHRDKDCPMTEITCEVIGCGRKIMRKDYEKHQDDAAKQHVRLLSATLQRVVETYADPQPFQIKWRVPDIAAKLEEALASMKTYKSPTFDILFRGSHKLCIQVEVDGNKLGLYVLKDIATSNNKNRLDISGTSFTVTKDGQSDMKRTYPSNSFLEPPRWGYGWSSFIADMTPYIDNDGINITLDLKLNKINEPLVL